MIIHTLAQSHNRSHRSAKTQDENRARYLPWKQSNFCPAHSTARDANRKATLVNQLIFTSNFHVSTDTATISYQEHRHQGQHSTDKRPLLIWSMNRPFKRWMQALRSIYIPYWLRFQHHYVNSGYRIHSFWGKDNNNHLFPFGNAEYSSIGYIRFSTVQFYLKIWLIYSTFNRNLHDPLRWDHLHIQWVYWYSIGYFPLLNIYYLWINSDRQILKTSSFSDGNHSIISGQCYLWDRAMGWD